MGKESRVKILVTPTVARKFYSEDEDIAVIARILIGSLRKSTIKRMEGFSVELRVKPLTDEEMMQISEGEQVDAKSIA